MMALVRRGQEDFWPSAELCRRHDTGPGNTAAATPFWPKSLRAVAKALGRLPREPEPGSAARKIRARDGALWLTCTPTPGPVALPAALKVAYEISIWTAIDLGVWDPLGSCPRVLRELAKGAEFHAFCAVLINALRTANRPVQEVLGLGRGLCPFDWVEAIPINQLRALRRFLGALPEEGGNTLPAWRAAFARYPVPGHATVQDLWDAPIGHALRRVEAPISAPDFAEDEDQAAFIDDPVEFEETLQRIGESGEVSAAERQLLVLLYRGVPLADALQETGLIARLANLDTALEDYVDDLQERITAARLLMPA